MLTGKGNVIFNVYEDLCLKKNFLELVYDATFVFYYCNFEFLEFLCISFYRALSSIPPAPFLSRSLERDFENSKYKSVWFAKKLMTFHLGSIVYHEHQNH